MQLRSHVLLRVRAAGTPATAGKVVGTVALGAAAGAGAMAMDKQRKDHAPKELSNSLVGREPCSLQSSEVRGGCADAGTPQP